MGAPSHKGGLQPLHPKRKWQTITVATLLLLPAFWGLLAGLVSAATSDVDDAPNGAAAMALGIAVMPFVFVVLAFMSEQPRAPTVVLKAMGMAVAVGLPVSLVAMDAVTGIVAGVGAGGVVALRPEPDHGWKPRATGVLIASAYTFFLLRTVPEIALLSAPVFPLTALGLADHYVEWRRDRDAARLAAN